MAGMRSATHNGPHLLQVFSAEVNMAKRLPGKLWSSRWPGGYLLLCVVFFAVAVYLALAEGEKDISLTASPIYETALSLSLQSTDMTPRAARNIYQSYPECIEKARCCATDLILIDLTHGLKGTLFSSAEVSYVAPFGSEWDYIVTQILVFRSEEPARKVFDWYSHPRGKGETTDLEIGPETVVPFPRVGDESVFLSHQLSERHCGVDPCNFTDSDLYFRVANVVLLVSGDLNMDTAKQMAEALIAKISATTK